MAVAASLVVATAATYAALLSWDTHKTIDPSTGTLTGPYSAWQVIVCGLVLVALGAMAVRRGHRGLVFVIPGVFTLCWSVQAALDPNDDGLWPIGADLVLLGTCAGAGLLCALVPPRTD
jgi:uncharacterized membrane protein YfcA